MINIIITREGGSEAKMMRECMSFNSTIPGETLLHTAAALLVPRHLASSSGDTAATSLLVRVTAEAVCVAGRNCWAGLLRRGSHTAAGLLRRGSRTAAGLQRRRSHTTAGLQPLCGAFSSKRTLIVGDLQSYSIIRYNILSTTPKVVP